MFQISDRVKQEMHDSLIKLYGVDTGKENNAFITELWDKLQTDVSPLHLIAEIIPHRQLSPTDNYPPQTLSIRT